MFKNKIMKKRLIAVFLIAVLIPILVSAGVIAAYFNQVLENERRQTLSSAITAAGGNIQLYLEELLRITAAPLHYSEILDTYRYINAGMLDAKGMEIDNFMQMRKYQLDAMRLLYSSRKGVLGIAFYPFSDLEKAHYVSTNYGYRGALTSLPADKQPWFDEVMQKQGGGVIIPKENSTFEKSSPEIFSAARLIVNINSNTPIGIIKVDAQAYAVRDLFNDLGSNGNSIIALIDQNDSVIYSTNPLSADMVAKASSGSGLIKTAKDSYEPYIYQIDGTGWNILYYASRKDILSKTSLIFYVAGLIALLCVFAAMLSFKRYSREILDKVSDILNTMKLVETGDLSARATVEGSDELALIGAALNRTVEKLDERIKSEYVAQISRKNAEYHALQSQINPHFLYNTLACFIGLNRLGEKKMLEKSIIQLTNLLRFACKNDDVATVESEAEFLRNYLQLMQIRYEERLNFEITVEEGANGVNIPKLVIQPLVENAIVHGMEPYDLNILITVNAKIQDGKLIITVCDTGKGFDTSKANFNKSVGVSSVTERLKLFCAQAEFKIDSLYDRGTDCTIILPIDGGER